MGRRYSLRVKAAALALALALAVLGVEALGYLGFWLKHRRTPYRFATENFYQSVHLLMTDHPYLPYRATPGEAGHLRFNSLGDRGPEPDRPKRRVRIVCYGGSTTFDGAHAWEKTWPGYLQAMLGPERYEVINAAQNGATTADSLVDYALIRTDLEPDYVLALEGINDLESSYFPGFKPDYSHRRRKIAEEPYPVFRRLPRWLNHSAAYVALRWRVVGPRGDLHALFSRPGAYDFENGPFGLETFRRNLLSLDALARKDGARLILGTPPYYQPWADANFGRGFGEAWRRGIEAENRIQRELARAEPNIFLADVAAAVEPSPERMTDFCHFNERGNELIARAFYKAVLQAQRRR